MTSSRLVRAACTLTACMVLAACTDGVDSTGPEQGSDTRGAEPRSRDRVAHGRLLASGKWIHRDATNDVWTRRERSQRFADTDVTSIAVTSTSRTIRITLRFRAGTCCPDRSWGGPLTTSSRANLTLMGDSLHGGELRTFVMRNLNRLCDHGADYHPGAAALALSYPRSCLGNPEWIRFGMAIERRSHFDDALSSERPRIPRYLVMSQVAGVISERIPVS